MPPVAETFKEAVVRLLAGRSLRSLAQQLSGLEGSTQTAEDWRRRLNRYDTTWPEEASAKLIAKALGVPRSKLPRQPTTAELLAALEATLLGRLGELEMRLDATQELIARGFLALGVELDLPGEERPPQAVRVRSTRRVGGSG